jgi:hypothetical protein
VLGEALEVNSSGNLSVNVNSTGRMNAAAMKIDMRRFDISKCVSALTCAASVFRRFPHLQHVL